MNAYQKYTMDGLKLLDLAKTYAEDGAPATAAERAAEAAEQFRMALSAKNRILQKMAER